MKVFPAIDIIEGKCVRLTKGLADQKTIYQNSPVEMAKIYQDAGFKTIHVVDLDSTLGKGNNDKVLNEIRNNVDIKIEVAGGIRSKEAIDNKFNEGFDIIVIGTFAIKNIDEVLEFEDKVLKKLSIALDIKDNQIASHGWQQTNTTSLDNIIEQYNKKDIHSFFITDVANDGMLSGLNMNTFQVVKKLTDIFDIELSQKNGFDNVVVGKAIYENKISLESLIKFNA
jgi:phosphoribosylformimino-5-aminoimidazole carboxamide ribotide isomerase